jgi:methylated-DNA-[protein]-cysteine S-methyltransferase
LSPIACRKRNYAHQNDGGENEGSDNKERLFHRGMNPGYKRAAHTLGEKWIYVNFKQITRRGMARHSPTNLRQAQISSDIVVCGGRLFAMEKLYFTNMESAVGPLFLAASASGLVALEFDARLPGQQSIRANPRNLRQEQRAFSFEESAPAMRGYVGELEEYFCGKCREFTFPLDLRGTDFQIACWQALRAIPFGETRSYAHIARAIGQPNAFRAVGMANNRNPIAIVVPCHRVIASDGKLCGYGGGLDVKGKLLELEGALAGVLVA